jgi:hypothetical protein
MARWAGYDSVDALNHDHDPLHRALCRWLGIESHSMRCAEGEPYDTTLAGIEEEAVLCVQRLAAHHGVGVPRCSD